MNQALHVYIRGPFGAPTSRVFQVVTVFVFSSQLGSSVYSPIQKQIQHSVFHKHKRPAVCAAKYNLFAISVQAQHAVLIGTGIGVTPYASILQSIMHR